MEYFKDKSKHKHVNRIKIFDGFSKNELEDEINKFAKHCQIVSTETSIKSEHVNKGLGLVDVDHIYVTVVYLIDETQERINERIYEMFESILKNKIEAVNRMGGFPLVKDLSSMISQSKEEFINEQSEIIKNSESFIKFAEAVIDEEEGRYIG